MPRAFVLVLDSVGIGGAPDAGEFFNGDLPDAGANTVGHIAQRTNLAVPTLDALGLGAALTLASGLTVDDFTRQPTGAWGAATEISRGKDTPSGHWELMGCPVPFTWHHFPDTHPAFPAELSASIAKAAGTDGILGDCHASGTKIIDALGAEHLRTGWPIVYTSADSVLQIAAHADWGHDRLQRLCAQIAPDLHAMRVGRVIARPFDGSPGAFVRTKGRRDYAMAPPSDTALDALAAAGRPVRAVGKIGDIFSMRGISDVVTGADADLMEALIDLAGTADDGSFVFANLVEFDSEYGHRRDVDGYARHLEWVDGRIGALIDALRAGDLLIVTADHGNDPSWAGSDHTRERVPVLCHGLGARPLGHLAFADVGATVCAHLGVDWTGPGTSFL
ncbi:MAG: phosphopentomutase [Paracoccaceae bacterium]